MRTTGIRAFLDMLAAAGVRHVFGNPGTSELPLVDALAADDRFLYVLGLQEVPVMAMADGFAMASRSVGVVNLHISCGLGNAMGMLYNAWREGTPLLITAGQQDRRLMFEEPILWSDMATVARPWTKWSAEVQRVQDVPSAVRRALQTALAPPSGPVFLALPMDLQSEEADLDLTLAPPLDVQTHPPTAAVYRAANLLGGASNPGILAGSRVVEAGATRALQLVAETLGAPIVAESGTTHGRLPCDPSHPLYAQGLPLWSPEVRERLAEFDVLLVAGMDLLRQYVYHEPSRAIPEHVRLVHIDPDPWQIGKNYPADVGLVGDLYAGLIDLRDALDHSMWESDRERARARGDRRKQAHAQARQELTARAEGERNSSPLSPLGLMASLARVLPEDAAVVEEAVTTTNTYLERLGAIKNASGYFGHRGWALGWGLGCALGVKLAWPNRPVLAILGEGAAMYGIQGLWTAARYGLPVTFVVANNAQYRILKVGAQQLGLPQAMLGKFTGLDLSEPEIDIVGLARSLGVEAHTIHGGEELSERVRESLAGDRPRLFNVPIDRALPGRLQY